MFCSNSQKQSRIHEINSSEDPKVSAEGGSQAVCPVKTESGFKE